MSTTLATILVGLGYDLSALEKGSPEAFRLINQQTANMSAEMKRTAREGAESWRLIDEALGIHVSRPLTRLITEEFPGLAKAMGSVLGFGAAGALAVAGFEFFDKIAQKVEQAQKHMEELRKAEEQLAETTKKLGEVWELKIANLGFKPQQNEASGGAGEALSQFRELFKGIQDEQEKVIAASGFWQQQLRAFGDSWDDIFNPGLLKTKEAQQAFSNLGKEIGQAFSADQLAGTDTALDTIQKKIDEISLKMYAEDVPGHFVSASNAPELQQQLDLLDRVKTKIEDMRQAWEHAKAAADAHAAAIERQKQLAEALAKFPADLEAGYSKLHPQNDPFQKLRTSVTELRIKAINDFRAIEEAGGNALDLRLARQQLQSYEQMLDRVLAKARADADLSAAIAGLPKRVSGSGMPSIPASPETTPILQLAPLRSDLEELRKVQTDANVAFAEAGRVLDQIETPTQRYNTALQKLIELQKQGRLTTEDLAGAQQDLKEWFNSAEIEMLRKQGGAMGGAQAFAMQWMGDTRKGSDGQFTFDLLNKGLQGFEDETVKAITGAKTNWKEFFDSLDQMAIKFLLNKGMAELFRMLAGSGLGKSLGLDKVLGGVNPAQIAQTAATTANTAALVANTTVLSLSAASGAAAGAGGMAMIAATAGVTPFADGTDSAPGGLAMVGEMGPELVNLPSGSGVVPNSAFRNGAMHVPITIDARGAQMGVGEQIARAIEHQAPIIIARAVIEAHETQRRTAH